MYDGRLAVTASRFTPGRLAALAVLILLGLVWVLFPNSDETVVTEKTSIFDQGDQPLSKSLPAEDRAGSVAPTSTPPNSTPPTALNSVGLPGETGLKTLQSESVRPWTARRSGMTNRIRTLVRGLWTTGNAADYRTAAERFVRDYSQPLFGVSPEQVVFDREDVTDRTKMIFTQKVNGVSVFGATMVLFFEDGGMTRVQNDFASDLPVDGEPPPDGAPTQAFTSWNERLGSAFELVSKVAPKTVLYPEQASLAYAFDFVVREISNGKTYRVLVDARDGHTIKKSPTQVQ